MNRFYRKVAKNSIIVSVDLSSFTKSDIESIIDRDNRYKFIKPDYLRNKVYSMKMTKQDFVLHLSRGTDADIDRMSYRLRSILANCDADFATTCTEAYISCGRFLELGVGDSEVLHVDDYDFSFALQDLVFKVLDTRLSYLSEQVIKKGGVHFA